MLGECGGDGMGECKEEKTKAKPRTTQSPSSRTMWSTWREVHYGAHTGGHLQARNALKRQVTTAITPPWPFRDRGQCTPLHSNHSLSPALRLFNPFTAPACKISGLKWANIHTCKQYIWRSYNKSTLNTVRILIEILSRIHAKGVGVGGGGFMVSNLESS